MKDKHVALIARHYPSIGHAIHDLSVNGKESKVYDLVGDEDNPSIKEVLQRLYESLRGKVDKLYTILSGSIDWSQIVMYQISPDFLNNLLDNINEVLNDNIKKTEAIICTFFDYIRKFWNYISNADDKDEFNPIKEEITNCQKLFEIVGNKILGIIATIARGLLNTIVFLKDKTIEAGKYIIKAIIGSMEYISKKAKSVHTIAVETITYMYIGSQEITTLFAYVNEEDLLAKYIDIFMKRVAVYLQKYIDLLKKMGSKFEWITNSKPVKELLSAAKKIAKVLPWLLSVFKFGINILTKAGYLSQIFISMIQKPVFRVFTNIIQKLIQVVPPDVDIKQTKQMLVKLQKKNVKKKEDVEIALKNLNKIEKQRKVFIKNRYDNKTIGAIVNEALERISFKSSILSKQYFDKDIALYEYDKLILDSTGMSADQYLGSIQVAIDYAHNVILENTLSLIPQSIGINLTSEDKRAELIENIRMIKLSIKMQDRNIDDIRKYIDFNDDEITSLHHLLEVYENKLLTFERDLIETRKDIIRRRNLVLKKAGLVAAGGIFVLLMLKAYTAESTLIKDQNQNLMAVAKNSLESIGWSLKRSEIFRENVNSKNLTAILEPEIGKIGIPLTQENFNTTINNAMKITNPTLASFLIDNFMTTVPSKKEQSAWYAKRTFDIIFGDMIDIDISGGPLSPIVDVVNRIFSFEDTRWIWTKYLTRDTSVDQAIKSSMWLGTSLTVGMLTLGIGIIGLYLLEIAVATMGKSYHEYRRITAKYMGLASNVFGKGFFVAQILRTVLITLNHKANSIVFTLGSVLTTTLVSTLWGPGAGIVAAQFGSAISNAREMRYQMEANLFNNVKQMIPNQSPNPIQAKNLVTQPLEISTRHQKKTLVNANWEHSPQKPNPKLTPSRPTLPPASELRLKKKKKKKTIN